MRLSVGRFFVKLFAKWGPLFSNIDGGNDTPNRKESSCLSEQLDCLKNLNLSPRHMY